MKHTGIPVGLIDAIVALNQDGVDRSEYTLQSMPQYEVPVGLLKKGSGNQTHPPKTYSNKKPKNW